MHSLYLTVGGGADLEEDDELVWCSDDDPDFATRFPEFLQPSDCSMLLEYLVEVGELTNPEADRVQIFELSLTAQDLHGFMR